MKTQKNKSEITKDSAVENTKDYEFKIVENGNCFELHKVTNGVIEKKFIQANTNAKDFKAACKKYQK